MKDLGLDPCGKMPPPFVVAAGILPAVEPGILPGGLAVGFVNLMKDLGADPGAKMPPFTAEMPTATGAVSRRSRRHQPVD